MFAFERALDSYFHVSKRGSTVRNELLAGVVSFMTVSYVLLVNPHLLSKAGISAESAVVATAAGSAFASIVCGFFSNLPMGLAPGVGLTAYMAFGVVRASGETWQVALAESAIAGAILALLAITRVSELIMKLIPLHIKLATVVGMGCLLAIIGLEDVGLIVGDRTTLVTMGSLNSVSVWICLAALILMASLAIHEIKGAIFIGIILCSVVYWAVTGDWPESCVSLPTDGNALLALDFSGLSTASISGVCGFLFVGLFDVSGTLYGLSKEADLVDDSDAVPGGLWAFVAAGAGSMLTAALGGSPVIIPVENAAGIKEGGRTGLTAITVGLLFLLSLFLAPLMGSIPTVATSSALLLVGAMMMAVARDIEWSQLDIGLPAFLTVIMMPYTFSIPHGLVFGIVASAVLFVTSGDFLAHLPPALVPTCLYGRVRSLPKASTGSGSGSGSCDGEPIVVSAGGEDCSGEKPFVYDEADIEAALSGGRCGGGAQSETQAVPCERVAGKSTRESSPSSSPSSLASDTTPLLPPVGTGINAPRYS